MPDHSASRSAQALASVAVRRPHARSWRRCARSSRGAAGEGRRIALVGGEAGSGKSRLVREFAHEVAADGVLVLYGACDAVVRTPYRPFVEALEPARARAPTRTILRADLGSAGGELTPPAARPAAHASAGCPQPVAADPDTERHRLHTAVTDLLAGAARRQPLAARARGRALGRRADAPRCCATSPARRPTRGCSCSRPSATPRPTCPPSSPTRSPTCAAPTTSCGCSSAGCTEDDVGEFVRRAAAGAEIDPALARARRRRSATSRRATRSCSASCGGRCVETDALVDRGRHLRLTGRCEEIATPESVREVVSQRLARLDRDDRRPARARRRRRDRSSSSTCCAVAAPAELERLDALEPAVRSGMIEELPSPTLAYRFTHELVRRALYDRLSGAAPRRAAPADRRGARGDRPSRRSGRVLADLAHHFAAAAPIGGPGPRGRVQPAAPPTPPRPRSPTTRRRRGCARRCGSASTTSAGAPRSCWRSARPLFRDGHARSRRSRRSARRRRSRGALGDGELLARAAIGFENACWRPALTDAGGARAARGGVGGARPGGLDAARRRARRARARARVPGRGADRRATSASEAIAMARRIDDRHGLAGVLMGSYWARATTDLDDDPRDARPRRATSAEQIGDIEVQAEAMEWRIAALMALGRDRRGRAGSWRVALGMAQDTRQPFILHVAEHYELGARAARGAPRRGGAARRSARASGASC